jgi:hypothetical protein
MNLKESLSYSRKNHQKHSQPHEIQQFNIIKCRKISRGVGNVETKKTFKLNKIQIAAISAGLVIMAGFGVFSYWTNATPSSGGTDRVLKQAEEAEASVEEGGLEIQIDENVEQVFPSDLKEFEVQSAIHHMSHQKVEAEKKWGAILITEERVKRLYDVVVANQNEYKYANTYIKILERWLEGDFSQAVSDHNAIWELQDGNVGKATGLLSMKEEEKFIEKYMK